MGESDMSGIQFYYAGKMFVLRLAFFFRKGFRRRGESHPVPDGRDIRSGLLVNTESGETRQILYTHEGMLAKGYTFGCTGDLADTKLLEMIHGNDLPAEACEESSRD